MKTEIQQANIKCSEHFCPNRSTCEKRTGSPDSDVYANLSGTPLCPSKLERRYSCWDCVSGIGEGCTNKQRHEAINNGTYNHNWDSSKNHCQYFELSGFGIPWDRNTGEKIY